MPGPWLVLHGPRLSLENSLNSHSTATEVAPAALQYLESPCKQPQGAQRGHRCYGQLYLRAEPPGKKQGSWYMVFWAHHGAWPGDKCHYCIPGPESKMVSHWGQVLALLHGLLCDGDHSWGHQDCHWVSKETTGQKATSSRTILSWAHRLSLTDSPNSSTKLNRLP